VLSRSALRQNLEVIRHDAEGRELIAMVKANAYGHGLIPYASELWSEGVRTFGVVAVDEALTLRRAMKDARILLWGGTVDGAFDDLVANHITPVLYSTEIFQKWAAFMARKNTKHPIHLELDTGIARSGIRREDLDELLAKPMPENVVIEAVATHYSHSESDDRRCKDQLKIFEEMLGSLRQRWGINAWTHVANSGGIVNGHHSQGEKAVRPGIMLYGYASVENGMHELVPVGNLQGQVLSLKSLKRGDSVGYNGTFVAKRPTTIACLGLGYADGVPRELSNRIDVSWKGRMYPLVGTVSMDVLSVDVTDCPEPPRPGDWITLFGRDRELYNWAYQCRTITYEILTHLSQRVHRVWQEDV
jgi:alanine racemase